MSAAEKVAASPTAGLLHRYRTLAGLSQKELAERAGLSRRGISDLERGARRAAYPATLRRLVRALRLTDADETALLRARYGDASKLDAEAATTEPRPARVEWTAPGDDNPPSLPNELSSFVGRAQEVAEVLQLLGTTRLLTLVGAGGVGKTRLALRVAAIVAGDYADGVWLIDLAPLTDANLLIGVVATALRIQEQPGRALIEAIADVLRRRAVLLVLDNCEHLVQSCSEIIERLLSACPHLCVLATSRDRMGLAGELTWRCRRCRYPGVKRRPMSTP